mmetsp:Transcript_10935/g.19973  ORF Transcript_10935/g.19973 Transcript_10935/m.19973 type:complete len:88 (+) Transcript_10935:1943-2206(+)
MRGSHEGASTIDGRERSATSSNPASTECRHPSRRTRRNGRRETSAGCHFLRPIPLSFRGYHSLLLQVVIAGLQSMLCETAVGFVAAA